jgi:uncharacterized protein
VSDADETRSEIVDVPEKSRYELYRDGALLGFMDYSLDGDTFIALHTEIDPAYAGHGIGGELVTQVLDRVRDTGLMVRPLCPFVKRFLQRHREYDDIVVPRKGT